MTNERWWRALVTGPAWPLGSYLAMAFLLRLPAVLWAGGFEHPDQQFQSIDPAYHLATGAAWHEPWEFRDGSRSWCYPEALALVFRLLAAVGFEAPGPTMLAVRAVHALLSLLPVWLFWSVLVKWQPVRESRLPLLLFAVSGLPLASVQAGGGPVAATLAVAAGLALAGRGPFPAMAGLCLGFAFVCRFQDALFGPAFLVVLLFQRRWAAAAWFSLGCLPGIVVQGVCDLAAGGPFLGTVWNYVATNVGANDAANAWRTQPLPFYLYAGVVPVLALLPWPTVLRAAWARLRAGSAVLPAALVGAAVHLAVFSCVPRKALRFEQPAFVLLFAVLLAGFAAARGSGAAWHARALVAVHVGWWLFASSWFGNAGAVGLAEWLRRQPDWRGEVVVLGGDATSLGGFFYARPPADRVVGVPRSALAAARARAAPFVVVMRQPLDAAELAALGDYALAASFHGRFDLRAGERRYVYRRRARARRGRITCRSRRASASRRPSAPRPSSAWPRLR